jgi:hypothetical protein
MSPSIYGVAGTALLLIMGASAVPQAFQIWRNEPARIDNYRPATPFGRAMLRAQRRSFVLVLALGLPLLAAALVFLAAGGPSSAAGEGARGVLIAFACLAVVLIIPVDLFNRPSFLVPPHLRDEPGLIRELVDGM